MKIRKTFLVFFISFFVLNLNAQWYFEGGVKTGLWFQTKGINSTIDDYNASRPWLDKQMPHIHGGHGLRFVFGWEGTSDSRFGVYSVIETFTSNAVAHGIDPASGNKMVYDRLKLHFGGFGFGPTIAAIRNEHMDLLFGLDMNMFEYFVVWCEEDSTGQYKFLSFSQKEAYNHVNPSLNLFFRLGFFAGPFGICLTPKIDVPFYGRNELSGVGKTWPNTTVSMPDAHMRAFNFNISATIVICPKHLEGSD
jgi:hypothetical protein